MLSIHLKRHSIYVFLSFSPVCCQESAGRSKDLKVTWSSSSRLQWARLNSRLNTSLSQCHPTVISIQPRKISSSTDSKVPSKILTPLSWVVLRTTMKENQFKCFKLKKTTELLSTSSWIFFRITETLIIRVSTGSVFMETDKQKNYFTFLYYDRSNSGKWQSIHFKARLQVVVLSC